MKFRFIGTEDGPQDIMLYGIQFSKGEVVEVDGTLRMPLGKKAKLVKVVDKLKGNTQFETVETVKRVAKKSTKKTTSDE